MTETSRREFLKQAGILGACACMGSSLFSSCGTSAKTAATKVTSTETADMLTIPKSTFGDKNFVTVSTKRFEELIYVSKQADGSFVAVRMYCTHKGCGLNVGDNKLVCPCHGSEFSTTGEVLHGPAMMSLESFHTMADDQSVMIHFQ